MTDHETLVIQPIRCSPRPMQLGSRNRIRHHARRERCCIGIVFRSATWANTEWQGQALGSRRAENESVPFAPAHSAPLPRWSHNCRWRWFVNVSTWNPTRGVGSIGIRIPPAGLAHTRIGFASQRPVIPRVVLSALVTDNPSRVTLEHGRYHSGRTSR